MQPARAALESLLRARKLDTTLTTTCALAAPADRQAQRAPTGWAALDERLGGGLRRGHLSEIVGARSAGRTALFCRLASAATVRGELVALIDTDDRFDPASAAAAGVDLGRLLWIRAAGHTDRALKALTLVLQAGGFGLVAWDLADVRPPALRQVPQTTWMRLARMIEGSRTAAVLLCADHAGRSADGVTIAFDAPAAAEVPGEWCGTTSRARRLSGLKMRLRIVSARPAAAAR